MNQVITEPKTNIETATQAIIIASMHRSGSSLTTALLQNAGLYIGEKLMQSAETNPKGHFENLDFYSFHQKVLRSKNVHEDGWINQEISISHNEFLEEGKRILANNFHDSLWGWKDPRTTLFLEFWQQLIPNAKFLFVYRKPWEVIDSLYRRGDAIFQENPEIAIQSWLLYNEKILKFHQENSDISILVNVEEIKNNEREFVAFINREFNTNLNLPQTNVYDPAIFKTIDANTTYANLIYHNCSEVIELYHELEKLSWRSTKKINISSGKTLKNSTRIWYEWFNINHKLQQNKFLYEQLESTKLELVTAQSQFHYIQEELEEYYLKCQELQTLVEKYKNQLHNTEFLLDELQTNKQIQEHSDHRKRDYLQYQILVLEACSKYQSGDLQGMSSCLEKSLEFYPLSLSEIISTWLDVFIQVCQENNYPFNVEKLTESSEWKTLIESLFPKTTNEI